MVEIEPYIGIRESKPSKERFVSDEVQPFELEPSRFVAYIGGIPALMMEFFEKDYHLYGPRPNTTRNLLRTASLTIHYWVLSRKYLRLLGFDWYNFTAIFRQRLPRDRRFEASLDSEYAQIMVVTTEDTTFDHKISLAELWAAVEGDFPTEIDPPGLPFRFNENKLRAIEQQFPKNVSCLALKIPDWNLSFWADAASEPQPRSGISLATRLLPEFLVLPFITGVEFSFEDKFQLTEFINREVAKRYVRS